MYFRKTSSAIRSLVMASFLVVCFVGETFAEQEPVVQTPQGTIRGTVMKSRNDRQFVAYLGIPYAQPPVADLRFRPPVKASSWQGERDGTSNPPACIQQIIKQGGQRVHIGQEDCLYVNVYTPKGVRSSAEQKSSSYPVMVFIHGGPTIGESSTEVLGPQYLLDKDIVMVTFNYRQNRLGFLSLEDKHLPGNFGLKDQVMALKWIQENIESYGGDNKRVTLAGQSGGAVCVGMHMISPLSKGLFHRVIMQSGSPLSFWALNHRGVKRSETMNFTAKVNCKHENSEEIVKCLQNLAPEKFFLNDDDENIEEMIVKTMPIVREPEDVHEPFLTGNPWEEITKVNQYPMLIGINSAEGDIIANPLYSDHHQVIRTMDVSNRMDLEDGKHFSAMLGYYYIVSDAEERNKITSRVKTHYFGAHKYMVVSFREFVELYTDRGFAQPAIDTLRNYHGQHNRYLYYYDHINENRLVYGKYEIPFGASHGEELISLFYLPKVAPEGVSGNDRLVSEQMVEYWTNFVHHGTPNGARDNKLTRWESIKGENGSHMHIRNGTLEMRPFMRKDGYAFWHSLNIRHDF